jgi:protein involved in polysaccharide export with SLBB domain
MKALALSVAGWVALGAGTWVWGGLAVGDDVQVVLKGVPVEEQGQVNGVYAVHEGGVRLPLLEGLVPARGLTLEQFARAAERAYQVQGIYAKPAIEVKVIQPDGGGPQVNVGGYVGRPGFVPFRKGLTLLQAIQAAGDRTEFGGGKIVLVRGGQARELDFTKQEHRNLRLEANDTVTVKQRRPWEVNRG